MQPSERTTKGKLNSCQTQVSKDSFDHSGSSHTGGWKISFYTHFYPPLMHTWKPVCVLKNTICALGN